MYQLHVALGCDALATLATLERIGRESRSAAEAVQRVEAATVGSVDPTFLDFAVQGRFFMSALFAYDARQETACGLPQRVRGSSM